jgi:inner membrane protein involved in colicin E2 resistance
MLIQFQTDSMYVDLLVLSEEISIHEFFIISSLSACLLHLVNLYIGRIFHNKHNFIFYVTWFRCSENLLSLLFRQNVMIRVRPNNYFYMTENFAKTIYTKTTIDKMG